MNFNSSTKRNLVAGLLTLLLCGFCPTVATEPALAQTEQNPLQWTVKEGQDLTSAELDALWAKLDQSPVQRLNGLWSCEQLWQPNPKIDVNREVARLIPDSKDVPDELKKRAASYNAKLLQARRDGTTLKSEIHVFRVGEKVKAEIRSVDKLRDGGPAQGLRLIDFYNGGKDVAASITEQQNLKLSLENSNSPKTQKKFIGIVTRNNPDETLSYTAIYEAAILLTGAKVSHYFPRNETRVTATESQIFLDKKVVRDPEASPDWSQKVRLVLARSDLRPRAILTTLPNDYSKWTFFNVVEDFTIVDGTVLPEKVIVGDVASSKPGGTKSTYTLQSVKINDEVDPNSVLLPTGVAVTDYRFGKDRAVSYVIKDGLLLSDEQVKKLLGEKLQVKSAGVTSPQQNTNYTPLMMLLGLGLLGIGGVMWKKGASEK